MICKEMISMAYEDGVKIDFTIGDISCAFVGEWDSGKTSIINSLIGTELPVKPVSTTAAVVKVKKSDTPMLKVEYSDGRTDFFSGTEVYVKVKELSVDDKVLSLDFMIPDLELKDNAVIVDTPGFNDNDTTKVSKAESVKADIIVFVLQGQTAALNAIQQQFINQMISSKGNVSNEVLFVVTHIDVIQEYERPELFSRFKELIHTDLELNRNVFFVSNLTGEGVGDFKKRLAELFAEKGKTIDNDRLKRDLRSALFEVETHISRKREWVKINKENNTSKKQELEKKISEALVNEREEKTKIRAKYRSNVKEFSAEVQVAIDAIISQVENEIDSMTEDELKQRDKVSGLINTSVKSSIEPAIEKFSSELNAGLTEDMKEFETKSIGLVNNLSINIPEYTPKMPKLSAEGILPAALAGSIFFGGWLNLPVTLGLGILWAYSDKLGLDKFMKDATDKLKQSGASAHKKTVKMTTAKSLGDFKWKLISALEDQVEKVVESVLKDISYVETYKKSYEAVVKNKDIETEELKIKKLEKALLECRSLI